ncbi:MAG: 3-methyl-2-oxobutanoate hydroxymethyltransferase [Deltaproteobacteria bacterium]|jgi:3-methyl-2-oxobutanoate hydroxymethyltransferase|nr:3-methyl-2-oxobutanoate hydroxymethyltransferase [Deltaproteobacteria bacterium]
MKRLSTTQLLKRRAQGERLVMVTCYDATFARLVERAGADMILIGDSLGVVIQGHEHTIPVTLDEVIYHCRAVARGCAQPHLVGDLPFGSYQASHEEALRSAMRLMKEGGVQSVKLEGGERVVESVARITAAGVPVVGHLGLTPQSVHQLGGYGLQARTEAAAARLLADAVALQEAGAFALVLEGIPAPLAAQVTARLSIPTIGIGAGPECGGQVLVLYDLLGLDERFTPKFLKKYDDLSTRVTGAVSRYAAEVREGSFPGPEHTRQG